MPSRTSFRANGKVLLSGEYIVLDGALALGVPLSKGQQLSIAEGSGSEIVWQSTNPKGEIWFSGKFDLFGFDPIKTSDEKKAARLKQIFEAAVRLNSDFLSKWKKYKVQASLDFDPEWGLGSSSTLISCIAQWAEVDPFDLLESTFGGSGYDVACAISEGPILYRSTETELAADPAHFEPSFSDQIYLVYLGQKQDTRAQIEYYHSCNVATSDIEDISQISQALCSAPDLAAFDKLILDHEKIMSAILNIPRIGESQFADYWGGTKSLGAWGGDFILATSSRSPDETQAYFNQKGLEVFFKYEDLALNAVEVAQQKA